MNDSTHKSETLMPIGTANLPEFSMDPLEYVGLTLGAGASEG